MIPNPIKEVHKGFFDYDRTIKGGGIFLLNRKREILALDKKQFLIKGDMILRIGLDIINSLEVVSCFNVPLINEQNCIVVTSKDGKIQAMSQSAEDIFQVRESLFDYNAGFKKIYQVQNSNFLKFF